MEKSVPVCETSRKHLCICGGSVVLALLLVAAYCFYNCCNKKNSACVGPLAGEYQAKIALLQSEVSKLKSEMQQITQHTDQKLVHRRDNIREKWKAWMALRSKIESQEQPTVELERFRKLFIDDAETLELVEKLIHGLGFDKDTNDGKILAACKKYFKKVIKFKKVDHRKLMKISGYVLSSPNNCFKEEKE
jgi:hypothetical protein